MGAVEIKGRVATMMNERIRQPRAPTGGIFVDRATVRTRACSLSLFVLMVLGAVFAALPPAIRNASAGSVVHDLGNADLEQTDFGRIVGEYITWNGVRQTADILATITIPGFGTFPMDEESWLGLYQVQNAYDLVTPNIADSFGAGDAADDYTLSPSDVPIYFQENTPSMQKSYATYTNTGTSTGDANDTQIKQTTWTPAGADWAVIEFKVTNIKAVQISGLRVAYHGYPSLFAVNPITAQTYDLGGVGGDGGDDRDAWNGAQSIYTVEDNNGAGTAVALASADTNWPINIYHGEVVNPISMFQSGSFIPTDTVLNNALSAPAQLGVPNCPVQSSACSMRSIVGWNVGNLGAGQTARLPLVIAFGSNTAAAATSVAQARAFYEGLYYKYMITEIQDQGTQRVEIYNWNKPLANLGAGGLQLSPNLCSSVWSGGSWSAASIAANAHQFYTLGGADAFPGTEGATISLCQGGTPLDNASYGLKGLAPDPIAGESTAMIYSGEYTLEWSRDPTPTFAVAPGGLNDVPLVAIGPEVVLNEIYFNPNNPADKFVELYYKGSGSVDISNWDIVADTVYNIPTAADSTLSTTNRYYHLREYEDSAFFAALTVAGDNVYLYDDSATPVLQDRAGWTSAHTVNTSMTREPDGNGTALGYDDISSFIAGWVFDSMPTYSIVLIEQDQEKWGDPSYYALFSVNVTNVQPAADYIDIFGQSQNGWTVMFFEADKVTPLADKEMPPDGMPDTGLLPQNNRYQIWVRVYVPSPPPVGVDLTDVFAQATSDPLGRDRVILKTFVNPWVEPDADVEPPAPTTIYEKSAGALGYVNETTVTLNASGKGFLQYTGQDVMFVLDSSGSMWDNGLGPGTGSDPDMDQIPCNAPPAGTYPLRVEASWNYVDKMVGEDRGGYVDFDTMATLKVPLTTNYNYLKQDPSNGLWCSDQNGGTMFTPALTFANDELIFNGNAKHVKVIIFLTDGESNQWGFDWPQGTAQAARSAANDIIIFSIGLKVVFNPVPPSAYTFLNTIASMTGGQYYDAPDAAALDAIFNDIMDKVRSIAGYNPNPGTPTIMIDFVLDQGIDYIPGTFQLVPGTIEFDPNPDSIVPAPTNITLTWEWPSNELRVNEYWAVRFRISSTTLGAAVPVNLLPDSAITYLTAEGNFITKEFPLVTIEVLSPSLRPILSDVRITPGGDVNVSWNPVVTAEYYEVYGGPSQTSIDLLTYITVISAPQTWFIDTTNLPIYDEFYYVVRAVDTGTDPDTWSETSNTGGYFNMQFTSTLETFSLPLEPFQDPNPTLDWFAANIPNAVSVSEQDSSDLWLTYTSLTPGPEAQVGRGYVLELSAPSSFVFTGEPAAMISYKNGTGFSPGTTITVDVDAVTGDVDLSWPSLPGMQYYLYRSTVRRGFFTGAFTDIGGGPMPANSSTDPGAALLPGEYYYMVVPYDPGTTFTGPSTYSVGVVTMEFSGNDLFGLPVKPDWGDQLADWYVDQIPYCLGIVYLENGMWKPHFKEFPAGVYDTLVGMGRGYELTVYATARFSFHGW